MQEKKEDVIEISKEKKEKIKSFLQDKYNIILIGILILAFAIRIYYFFVTKNQALWWDEGGYGNIAKTFLNPDLKASPILDREFIIRPFFLPILWYLFLKIGFSEAFTKFFIILIPSILSVFLIYLIAKETLNKRAALISTFLFSVLWIHLFYSMRLMTETPALFLSLLSIYFFVRACKQDFKFKPFFLSILFLSLSIMMRFPFGLVGFAYILFIIFTAKFNILKKKDFWLSGIAGLIPLFLFFIYNFAKTGFFFPALQDVSSTSVATKFAFFTWNFIPHILQKALYVIFLIGILICLAELILGFGMTRKNKKLENHILFLLLFIISLAFFIFIVKAAEDRYLFVGMISIIYFISVSLDYIYVFIKKYYKIAAVIFLIFILAFGTYQQFKFGDKMIKDKKETYAQMKQAFSWLNENSNSQDIVMALGEMYSVYYAERITYSIPANETEFEKQINEKKPAFIVLSAFFPHPEYVNQYIQEHQNQFKVEKVVFFDAQQQQPAVIIYRIL